MSASLVSGVDVPGVEGTVVESADGAGFGAVGVGGAAGAADVGGGFDGPIEGVSFWIFYGDTEGGEAEGDVGCGVWWVGISDDG